jgi:phage baseplate assembly protein W
MPLLTGIKRISPLDVDGNVSIGVALPLDEKNLFKGTTTLSQQAKTNLINLLLTAPGERINLPDYGIGLRELLFEQGVNIEIITDKIKTQTSRYIPNISVETASTSLSEDGHTLMIKIFYRSTLDGTTDAIQLNFN